MHGSGLTDLVGREEELELLLRRWTKAKTSEGQVVLLPGEAGIGKSRLTAALLERLASEPHTRLRYFCSPQHTDSAFYPIISHWIDPTSLEALGRAVDRVRTLGVLLIVTHRPEFEPPWIGRPHVTPSPSIVWQSVTSTP
jgi:predicted ATPase